MKHIFSSKKFIRGSRVSLTEFILGAVAYSNCNCCAGVMVDSFDLLLLI